jgi:hypothetical protein
MTGAAPQVVVGCGRPSLDEPAEPLLPDAQRLWLWLHPGRGSAVLSDRKSIVTTKSAALRRISGGSGASPHLFGTIVPWMWHRGGCSRITWLVASGGKDIQSGWHIHGTAQNRRGFIGSLIHTLGAPSFSPHRIGEHRLPLGVTKNVTHVLAIFDPGFDGLLYFLNQNTQFGLDFYKKC